MSDDCSRTIRVFKNKTVMIFEQKCFAWRKNTMFDVCCGSQTNNWLCLIAEIFGYLYPKVNSSDFCGINGYAVHRFASRFWYCVFSFIFPLFGSLAQSFCRSHHDARCANRFSIFLHVKCKYWDATHVHVHTHTETQAYTDRHTHKIHALSRIIASHTQQSVIQRVKSLSGFFQWLLDCLLVWHAHRFGDGQHYLLLFLLVFFPLFIFSIWKNHWYHQRIKWSTKPKQAPTPPSVPYTNFNWCMNTWLRCPSILQHQSTRNYSYNKKNIRDNVEYVSFSSKM